MKNFLRRKYVNDVLFAIALSSAFLYSLGGYMEYVSMALGVTAMLLSLSSYFIRNYSVESQKDTSEYSTLSNIVERHMNVNNRLYHSPLSRDNVYDLSKSVEITRAIENQLDVFNFIYLDKVNFKNNNTVLLHTWEDIHEIHNATLNTCVKEMDALISGMDAVYNTGEKLGKTLHTKLINKRKGQALNIGFYKQFDAETV